MALALHRTGQGPALVLLHPLGADHRVWDPLLPRLASQREVFAFDLPGFGASTPLARRPPTPRALAEAIAGELDGLGVERPPRPACGPSRWRPRPAWAIASPAPWAR